MATVVVDTYNILLQSQGATSWASYLLPQPLSVDGFCTRLASAGRVAAVLVVVAATATEIERRGCDMFLIYPIIVP
jgi:hypothetical protein